MSQEIITENAQSETQEANSNITTSDFVSRRLGQQTPPAETEEEVIEQTTDESPVAEVEETEAVEQQEENSEPQEEAEQSENVLSKLDLDEMSEAELQELSEKLGSRAVARYGELTAKRKAAERELEKLQSELNKQNPLETSEVANNPYSDIKDIEGLQQKAKEVNDVIEWAEDILFNADGYGPEDVVTEIEGKELTKAEVRKSLQNSRKSRDKYLPAQLKDIQREHQAVLLKVSFDAQAKEELPWLEGEDNDTRKSYEAMVNDARFGKLVEKADPEVGAQLHYLMAHAANSMYSRKEVPNSPTSPTLNPPKTSGISGASTSEKTVKKSTKALKDLNQRFKSSGKKDDFISLRTLQIKNR